MMKREIVNGKEYVFEKVIIEDREITLTGIVSDHNASMVEFKSYRPSELHPSKGQINISCEIDEFMSELKFLANYLNKKGLTDQHFVDSVAEICINHINTHKKIIDNDLYTYIDKALILQSSLFSSFGTELTTDKARHIWELLLHHTLPKIKHNLYITEYDYTDISNPKMTLTKATDKLQ